MAVYVVPGATSPSGSPYAGSYSLPQVAHDQVPERSSAGGSCGNASEAGWLTIVAVEAERLDRQGGRQVALAQPASEGATAPAPPPTPAPQARRRAAGRARRLRRRGSLPAGPAVRPEQPADGQVAEPQQRLAQRLPAAPHLDRIVARQHAEGVARLIGDLQAADVRRHGTDVFHRIFAGERAALLQDGAERSGGVVAGTDPVPCRLLLSVGLLSSVSTPGISGEAKAATSSLPLPSAPAAASQRSCQASNGSRSTSQSVQPLSAEAGQVFIQRVAEAQTCW